MAPLSGVLGKVADKTSTSPVVVLIGSHALVSVLLILALALPWFSVPNRVKGSYLEPYTSANLFSGGTDGAAALLLLSFSAVVAIAGVLVYIAAWAPIDAKLRKALVVVSLFATVFLVLSIILAFEADLAIRSRVALSRFEAGTIFALVVLPVQLVLGLLLQDFSRPANSAAPSTVSMAAATPVPGQASACDKV
jgi:hypothetical protein